MSEVNRRGLLLGAGAVALAAPFVGLARATEPVRRWPGFTWCQLCEQTVHPEEIRILPVETRGGSAYYTARISHCGSEYLCNIPVDGYNPRRAFPLPMGRGRVAIWCAKCDFWVDAQKRHAQTDLTLRSTVSCHGEWGYCDQTPFQWSKEFRFTAFGGGWGFTPIDAGIVAYPKELTA